MRVTVLGDSVLANRLRKFLDNMGHVSWFKPEEADMVVSAQYAKIFSEEEIEKYPYIINIHYSDINVLRGCNMMTHAIRAGIEYTGVTFHVIDSVEIDSGPIVAQVEVPIFDTDTSYTLYHRCMEYAYARFVSLWEVLKRKPEGTKPEKLGKYFPRELDRYVMFDDDKDREIRSLIFDDERGPILLIGGKEYELRLSMPD